MNLFVRTAVLSLALATPLAAQRPMGRTMTFDFGALGDREIRVGVEPIRSGAFSLNVMFANRDNSRGLSPDVRALVTPIGSPGVWNRLVGRELSLDIGPRVYERPVPVSAHLSYAMYAGVLAGFHYRDADAVPTCSGTQACPAILYVIQNSPSAGIEPIAEAGARFLAASALVIDAGIRARVVTFADPAGNYSVGDVVPRMSMSVGVTW